MLREKILAFRLLQAKAETLNKQQYMLLAKISEMENAIKSLEEIKENKECFISVGASVQIPAKVEEGNVLIGIGAGIFVEKKVEECVEMLRKRRMELEKVWVEVQQELNKTNIALQKLLPEIEKLAGKENV